MEVVFGEEICDGRSIIIWPNMANNSNEIWRRKEWGVLPPGSRRATIPDDLHFEYMVNNVYIEGFQYERLF
ncbi:hypothetical protein E2562_012026 [Oryza meyeriana var. granulata]|uniref:Uncharacterized protein n=1 Tax=Oryza meyeriana var. granulata TaxID=110450 RepID=A0A6G1D4D5_9ORYZ|nr:hypothetical protein E2562_012026 [Oryza meyeriana var. granulata]